MIIKKPSTQEDTLLALRALESQLTDLRKQLAATLGPTSSKSSWGSITSVRGRVTVDGKAFHDLLEDKGVEPSRFGEVVLKSGEAHVQAAIAAGIISSEEAESLIKIGADTIRVSPSKDAKLTAKSLIETSNIANILEDKSDDDA